MRNMLFDSDCRTAVTRAFNELRNRDVAEEFALESAATVFHFHHPAVSEHDARQVVREWVSV